MGITDYEEFALDMKNQPKQGLRCMLDRVLELADEHRFALTTECCGGIVNGYGPQSIQITKLEDGEEMTSDAK